VFLNPIVLSCLPNEIRLEWARDREGHEADLDHLLNFLKKEIRRGSVHVKSVENVMLRIGAGIW
jgi:hypothetical protein